ncbi:carboxylic ester hydrolase [Favolaschia claudopus]|uniref:Carboxylic ester hydrolase n=1 Tax=Favolaschia claudopus TaxID=2862362 RepID=A0AAW0DIH2_9AGAR
MCAIIRSCPYAALTGIIAYPNKTANFDRIVGEFLGQSGVIGEDCLTLNIWAKNSGLSDSTAARKAVMVFLYGGRFAIGGTNNPFYNGQYLADREDVLVVTVNYRTNIFGFPGAPNTLQNLGILDQRLALKWCSQNIAAFGGDPTRITIFGQSAGGASVDYHSFAFAEDPIAAGLISQSGTAFSLLPNSAELAASYWRNASAALGCASEDEDAVLRCMRGKNFMDVLTAGAQVVAVGDPTLLAAPAFQPTVDNVIVFANYTALAAEGKFAKLPYLLGSLDNESGFYRIRGFVGGLNLSDAQWELFTLEAFTCATAQTAAFRAKAGIPTWRYRYFGDWDNLRLYDCCPGSGAYHGSELELVFGTGKDVSGVRNGRAEERVSTMMMRAWAAFAKDPMKGLRDLGWPEYRLSEDTLIRLAFEDEVEASGVNPSVYDSKCAALEGSLAGAQGAF